MAGRILWHRRAEEDLTETYLHIAADSPRAGERLLEAVESAILLLVEHHAVGRPRAFRSLRARGLRSWAISGFEDYLLFYRIVGDDLEVVRLLHGARDLPRLLEEEP